MSSQKTAREWIQTLGLVAIPVVVAIAGNQVAKSNSSRETDAKMVEIAAQVLAGPASDSMRALRQWAVKVLAKHSDVPFPPAAESLLIRHTAYAPYEKGRLWLGGAFVEIPPDSPPGGGRLVPRQLCDSAGRNCQRVWTRPR